MTRRLSDLEQLRAHELLVQRATEGLDAAQQAELASLGADDLDSLDLAAAAIDVSTLTIDDAMPPALEAAIIAQGMVALGGPSATAPAVPAVAAQLPARREPRPARRVAPWILAAASVALSVGAVGYAVSQRGASREVAPAAIAPGDRDLQRLVLVPDGELLWSAVRDRGRLRLAALPANDPQQQRYQLWLVDGDRDPRFPVAAGLFDSTGDGVDIAVIPSLPIGTLADAFVTLEDRRGAVVSERPHLVTSAR